MWKYSNETWMVIKHKGHGNEKGINGSTKII